MKKSYRDKVFSLMAWLGFNLRQGTRTLAQAMDKMRFSCFIVNPELKIEETDLI